MSVLLIWFFVQNSYVQPADFRSITIQDTEAERYKSLVSRYFKAVRPIHFTLEAMISAQRYYEPLGTQFQSNIFFFD